MILPALSAYLVDMHEQGPLPVIFALKIGMHTGVACSQGLVVLILQLILVCSKVEASQFYIQAKADQVSGSSRARSCSYLQGCFFLPGGVGGTRHRGGGLRAGSPPSTA